MAAINGGGKSRDTVVTTVMTVVLTLVTMWVMEVVTVRVMLLTLLMHPSRHGGGLGGPR